MSNTMVLNGVKCFTEIERDLVYGLKNRLFKSDTFYITFLVNSLFYDTSNLTNYWNAILY